MTSNRLDLESASLPAGWKRETIGNQRIVYAEPGAQTLALPLGVTGKRTIRLGMVTQPGWARMGMQMRITPDGHWRRVRPMVFIEDHGWTVQDTDWITLDIAAGNELHIRPDLDVATALAYIALDDPAPAPPIHKNNVGVVFDTNMTMSLYQINEPEDLLASLEPYVDSDFTHIFWGTGVGTYSQLYFSESLGWHGQEQKDFMADHREKTARTMRLFADRGVDPLQMVCDYAHDNGMQLWADYRISKNHEHDFRDDYPGGRFLLEHEADRVQLRDGSPHHQCVMSFTCDAIREMAITSLVEQASYPVDGLYIDFLRKCPLVGWEPKSVEDFKQKTGQDAYNLSSREAAMAWYEHLCSYVTQFLRDLRKALEPVEQKRGSRVPIMAQVPGGWRWGDGIMSSMTDAMDPFTWMREGLIDYLAPAEATALMHEHIALDRIVPVARETGCKLWGAIGPQFRAGHRRKIDRASYDNVAYADTDPWRYMLLAHDFYLQGCEGAYIWEAQDMPSVPQRWNVIRRMGDRDYLRDVFGDKFGRYDGAHWVPQKPLENS